MSDPAIYDNQRTGLDLLARIEELTDGVHGDGHSWRHLLLACAAEIQRLTRRGDNYCEQAHEANKQLAECVNRLKALEATLPKTVDGVTIHHGMRAWVVFNDYAGWYTISGMESPPSSGESWRLFCGAICLSDRDCYSSPEAAKESP